jgi:general secretion pathway protein D
MMRPVFVPAVAAVALVLAAPALGQYSLNVRDADIRAFIQDAAKVTGRTFIIDQRVQGKVSVVTDRPLSRSEYFEVFLSTLRANGLVAVPSAGGALRVQPLEGAASAPSSIGRPAAANALVTEIFRLRAIDAPSAAETVRPLVSREGSVTANRAGNSLVVVDFADNVRRVREVVRRIDQDSAAVRVVDLKNAGAREIAESLSQLVAAGAGGGQGGAPAGAATIVPVDSSNSLVLRGDSATVARLAQVAAELDQRAANGTEVRVYWLEHADAQLLLPVLQQLTGQPVTPATQPLGLTANRGLGGAGLAGGANSANVVAPIAAPPPPGPGPAAAGQPGQESIIGRQSAIVTRFEGANAIIVAARPDTQRTIGEVIRQLDTRREQVLVEAIIVEISDQLAKRLGVQFLLGGEPGSDVPLLITNYSNAQPNILTIAGAVASRELDRDTTVTNGQVTTTTRASPVSDQLAQAAANSLLGATGGIGGFVTDLGRNAIFGTILNAVRSDTNSNLLSTPSIMTLDNQEARILVGQEIPITTGQALSPNFDNAFRTVQRQNVGIQLQVRPQINEGGLIKLILRQEVSSVAGPVSNDNQELILNKREIETTVTVDDGQIIALGGLLDDNERRTIERIPLLSDIPGLGELFKSRSRSRVKTNLMVFIRPTILRTPEDARRLAERRYGYVRAQQREQRPGREPTIDELVRDYMGAVPLLPPAPLPGSTPPALPAPPAGEPPR